MLPKSLKISILLCFFYVSSTKCIPAAVSETNSLVISTTTAPTEVASEAAEDDGVAVVPKIYAMRVDTNVTNRYAKTLITSKVKNYAKSAKEATFSVVTPEEAFISGFVMEIDGKRYEAYVQEKEEAQKTYQKATASGQAAAHVAVSARDSNRFTVSVNVEPQSKATFYLTYEELLKRQNEKYEIVINIHPGQPVKDLNVEVHIAESRPLKFVTAPALRSGNEISKKDDDLDPQANIKIINQTSAIVKFNPNIEKQKQYTNILGNKEENGLAGQFVVQYDVERDPHGGEVLVNSGYFVHFFAPDDLPTLPKQVIFVLDTSGSMEGIRITQLKEAMNSILTELKEDDVFSIVEFNSAVNVWHIGDVKVQYTEKDDYWRSRDEHPEPKTDESLPRAFDANSENIEKAKQVVGKLDANGGTDIQSALKVALRLVAKHQKSGDKKHQPIIVFLTDGEATVGETRNERIISTISELNNGKAPIFSLSFGDGADKKFLRKISLKNLGFARHIYEGADASIQLQEFYKHISSPLLSNVTFKYVSNVSEVTKTDFPILFRGDEIAVSGIILDAGFAPSAIECWGVNGRIKLVPTVQKSVGDLERLWAYLTVKQILEQRELADNKTGPTQEALKLALKYSFVTDVSSLVVVKPNDTSAVDTEEASKTPNYPSYAINAGAGFPGPVLAQRPFSAAAALPIDVSFSRPAFAAQEEPAYGGISNYASVPSPQLSVVRESAIPESSYYSTPFIPVSSTTTTTAGPEKPLWLEEIYKANGTISVDNVSYNVGIDETVDEKPQCTNAPKNSTTGICHFIHDCPQVYDILIDVQTYSKYFCHLSTFAGVCCPEVH